MILKHASRIWKSHDVKQKILITLAIIVLYKFLSIIPVPGVNTEALASIKDYLAANQ